MTLKMPERGALGKRKMLAGGKRTDEGGRLERGVKEIRGSTEEGEEACNKEEVGERSSSDNPDLCEPDSSSYSLMGY